LSRLLRLTLAACSLWLYAVSSFKLQVTSQIPPGRFVLAACNL
jgi:hypothetical protein